jgi:hypothetical protein
MILAGEAFVFDWAPAPYAEFREMMGMRLGVSAANVGLIGSAKLGISLNEGRLFRKFRRESDLDLVVVHPSLFDEAALELRAMEGSLRAADSDERRRLKQSRGNVFSGYLRPDQLPMVSSLHGEWLPLLAGPYSVEPARSHVVKAWIFKSWEHARICYTEHFERIQVGIQRLVELAEERDGDSR